MNSCAFVSKEFQKKPEASKNATNFDKAKLQQLFIQGVGSRFI
jgi:hypothetical protein